MVAGDLLFFGCRRCRVTRGDTDFGGDDSTFTGSAGFLPLFFGEGGATTASACSPAFRLDGSRPRRAGVAASSSASAAGASAIVSRAVPLDTLRERRADCTDFAARVDDERRLVRVDAFASTSSSCSNTSLTSAMVSKLAPEEAAVDFRRELVDLVGVAVRSLGVPPTLRRAGVGSDSFSTLEAVFLVGLGVLRGAAGFCAALRTAFLAGIGVSLLSTLISGAPFSGVFVVEL